MPISSRALGKTKEGSETRDTTVSPEHPPLYMSDDIVRSLWKHKTNEVQPYPQFNTADGIAFSCSIKGTPEKSLQYIFKALYGTYEDKDCDLRRWSHQGVLLLNTALTVRIKGIGSHYMIWKPFISYLFTEINKQFKDIPIVLLGKKAEEWELYFTNQKVYKVPHPAAAAYNGGIWKHDDIFNKVNDYLATQNKTIINW